VTAALLFALKC